MGWIQLNPSSLLLLGNRLAGWARRKGGCFQEVSQKSFDPQHAADHHSVLLLLLPLHGTRGQPEPTGPTPHSFWGQTWSTRSQNIFTFLHPFFLEYFNFIYINRIHISRILITCMKKIQLQKVAKKCTDPQNNWKPFLIVTYFTRYRNVIPQNDQGAQRPFKPQEIDFECVQN